MKRTAWVCLLLAAPLGCYEAAAPAGGSAPNQTDVTAPIQTDAAAYQLEPGSTGYTVTIGFVFTNPRRGPVYVVNCGGNAPPGLEKLVDGEWTRAWSAIVPLCLSPPITIAAGQQYQGKLHLFAGYPTNNAYPKFDTPQIGGGYRLVWHDVLSSYDDRTYPFGEQLPLTQRVSNSFTLTPR
jgi:hypothetical protein